MQSNKKICKACLLLICILMLTLTGCMGGSGSSGNGAEDPAEPDFNTVTFSASTTIDNGYLPLVPGTTNVYQAETEDGVETIVVEVLEDTRVVAGITCVVVRDRVFLDDLLVEDTYDWYAQDDDGNIWYMGEDVTNYEYDDEGNLIGTNNDGSWEADLDIADVGSIAEPGILIKALPAIGDSYQQEYYEGEAEDMAEVVETGLTLILSDGRTYNDIVKTLEWNPLEEDSEEFKYYARDTGLLKETSEDESEVVEQKAVFLTGPAEVPDFNAAVFSTPDTIDNAYMPFTPGTTLTYEQETEDGTETIVVEVLVGTRVVNGINCIVVRDTVTLGGDLIEDTHDWFAQDDDGNVWYMGEEVINYVYDDEGNLISTNDDGSWEAGIDGTLPGIQMWATPVIGDSYYQEYYENEAEDLAMIVAVGIEVELGDLSTYEDCLQTIDWNPLEPETLEYKYYAPGVGLIKEETVGSDEGAMEIIVD